MEEKAPIIKFTGNFLQSYKYLLYSKREIRKIFEFSKSIKLQAHSIARKLFKYEIFKIKFRSKL